jgi:hypothetical protein
MNMFTGQKKFITGSATQLLLKYLEFFAVFQNFEISMILFHDLSRNPVW